MSNKSDDEIESFEDIQNENPQNVKGGTSGGGGNSASGEVV
jgi:hypothetical protein